MGESQRDTEAPLGINENLLPTTEPDEEGGCSSAGSEVLITYIARIGRSEVDNLVYVDFIETLLDKGGADVNFEDAHGQTIMHEVW